MKCKNCGAELLFSEGIALCQSCGSTFTVDNIYENIDVYICYIENDASGRRTKDSIIAQDIYKKLESAKIHTFFERITADDVGGDDLEILRYAAIQKAKAVLVLSTSIENFNLIAQKYSSFLEKKTIIPFCVDVNPSDIPKSFSKLQAINYNTIGWEKDLVNSLYKLLGRENEINASLIYANARKKRITIISIVLVLLLIISVAAFLLFGLGGKDNNSPNSQPSTQSQPLAPEEIYNQALDVMEQEKFVDALDLFSQIPEHANSANLIKQIYAKYEGYYKNENTSIHIEIFDNIRADIEIIIISDDKTIKIVESATLSVNTVVFDYIDNHQNTGKIEIKLEDSGLRLKLNSDSQTEDIENFFALAEKSDQPFLQLDGQTLMDWVENEFTFDQIKALGYDLEMIGVLLPNNSSTPLYKITNTDIYLSLSSQDLIGISAPAKMIAPSLIGKESDAILEDNIIYCPNSVAIDNGGNWFYFESYHDHTTNDAVINENTTIAIMVVPDFADKIVVHAYPLGDYQQKVYHWEREDSAGSTDSDESNSSDESADSDESTSSNDSTDSEITETPMEYVLYSVRFDEEIAVYKEPLYDERGIGRRPSKDDVVAMYLPAGTYNIVGWHQSSCLWGRLEGDIGWICYSKDNIVPYDE